jgi:hypothetical protein
MATNTATAPALAPVPAPTPSEPELAPAPLDVSHVVQCAQALASAHDARLVSTQHLALAELLAAVRELPPGAVPMLPRVEPLEKVRREVDGTAYELQVVEGCVALKILDVEGDDTLMTFDQARGEQFVADFRAVQAKAVDRG